MKDKEEVVKKLNKIEFHDAPVVRFSFEIKGTNDFLIDFALFDETMKSYNYWNIRFKGIKELLMDSFEMKYESDLEIHLFDYELKELFECKLI